MIFTLGHDLRLTWAAGFVVWSVIVESLGGDRVVLLVTQLVDGRRAMHQRRSLGCPVRGLQQLRQIFEVPNNAGVFGSITPLVNGQRATHQLLSVAKPVRGLEQDARQLRAVATFGWLSP